MLSYVQLQLLPTHKNVLTVNIENGSNIAKYNGTVTGDGSVDYELAVKAGQKYTITLSSPNKFLYFNVLDWGGSGQAIGDDAREVTTWSGKSDKDATYDNQVYLVRAEARRNTKPVNFNLSIEKSAGSAGGDHGGNGKVKVDDLKGVRASSGEIEMVSRGFKNVDTLKSGNTSYTIWWNSKTHQCIQVATADGKYDSLTDIHTPEM